MIYILTGIIITLIAIALTICLILFIKGNRILFFNVKKLFTGKWNPQDVNKYYNKWNDEYIKFYGNTIQAHRPSDIKKLHDYILSSAKIHNNMKIADAGCGFCGPAIYFAMNRDLSIDALTISEFQKNEAERAIVSSGLENKIKVQCADFHNMDLFLTNDFYDRVIFLESYGHAQNQKKVLKSAYKILKKEGCIYIKDYFSTDFPNEKYKRKLMKNALKNMNREYRYNTADLYFTIYWLRILNFKILFVKSPDFVLDNSEVVNAFEKANKIDLFGNDYKPYIVEPFEILAQKI